MSKQVTKLLIPLVGLITLVGTILSKTNFKLKGAIIIAVILYFLRYLMFRKPNFYLLLIFVFFIYITYIAFELALRDYFGL